MSQLRKLSIQLKQTLSNNCATNSNTNHSFIPEESIMLTNVLTLNLWLLLSRWIDQWTRNSTMISICEILLFVFCNHFWKDMFVESFNHHSPLLSLCWASLLQYSDLFNPNFTLYTFKSVATLQYIIFIQ